MASNQTLPKRYYGGQALLEGVLMRGSILLAMAARAPDHTIVSQVKPGRTWATGTLRRVPLVRGLLVLAQSFAEGMEALQWSASIATGMQEDAQPSKAGQVFTIVLAVTLMLAIFFATPVLLTGWLEAWLPYWQVHLVESAIRISFLFAYLILIGNISEIREVFAYHGAEHKTIHAYEADQPLDIAHIQPFSPAHPRCGTSFLLTVMVTGIIVFSFVGDASLAGRVLSRILLLPLVVGISYEFLRFCGAHRNHPLVRPLMQPGLWLQRFTTREPRDDQVEVALAAFTQLQHAEASAPKVQSDGESTAEVNA